MWLPNKLKSFIISSVLFIISSCSHQLKRSLAQAPLPVSSSYSLKLLTSKNSFNIHKISRLSPNQLLYNTLVESNINQFDSAAKVFGISEQTIDAYLEIYGKKNSSKKYKKYHKSLKLFRRYFNDTLKKSSHIRRENQYNIKHIDIENGLDFFLTLYQKCKTYELKAILYAFMENQIYNIKFKKNPILKIVFSLLDPNKNTTIFLNKLLMTQSDFESLKEAITILRLESYIYNDTIIIGRGHSFHITKNLFIEASITPSGILNQKENNILQTVLKRTLQYTRYEALPVTTEHQTGAVAYYSPYKNEFAYVIKDRSELDPFVHEIKHSRFQKFQERIIGYLKYKKWATPYEIDGQKMIGQPFGGFMNLLNEVNSWRIGTMFSTPMTDEQILKTLASGYKKQAGEEAVESFIKYWTPEKLKSKSIPKLVIGSIRKLNSLSEKEHIDLFKSKSMIDQHNAIRLLKAKHFKSAPNHYYKLIINLGNQTSFEEVRIACISNLKSYGKLSLSKKIITKQTIINKEVFALGKTFSQAWKNFNKNQNLIENMKIIVKLHTKKMKHKYLVDLFENILSLETDPKLRQASMQLLNVAIQVGGIKELTDQTDEKGVIKKKRLPHSVSEYFGPQLDNFLYNKISGNSTLESIEPIIHLLSLATYPEELPRFHQLLKEIIVNPKYKHRNQILILFFHIYGNKDEAITHWQDSLLKQSLNGGNIDPTIKEFRNIYIDNIHGHRTFDVSFINKHLRATHKRKIYLKKVAGLSIEQEIDAKSIAKNMFKDLSSEYKVVHKSALYAFASHPGYLELIGENELIAAIKGKDKILKFNILKISRILNKGYFPGLEREIEAQKKREILTKLEKSIIHRHQLKKRRIGSKVNSTCNSILNKAL